MSWSEIFGTPPTVTVSQEIARAILIFFYVLVLVRIAGPRSLAKLSALDVIASVITGSSLSRALTGNSSLTGTLAAIAVFFALHWLVNQASGRSSALAHLFEGTPVELAANGNVLTATLRAKGISGTGFEGAIRQSGLNDPREAERVVLEPNGRITVCPRPNAELAPPE